MRGVVPGLNTPHPIGKALPSLYQDDDFVQRFVAGLDEQLAPLFSTLDNFDAYLDPWLTPADFLLWLSRWVGLELDERWPEERSRALVARAVELFGSQGTVRGLKDLVALCTGVVPEITDGGGATSSTTPESPLPGHWEREFRVILAAATPSDIDVSRLQTLVDSVKPAHLVAKVEVMQA